MAVSEEQTSVTGPSYILLELDILEDIYSPIKSSSRIKYTCFDISRRYLVLGSSSGDLFVFLRDTLTYLNTVPSKEGSIVQVCIAAEENVLGYASSRGHVLVVEHNAEKSSSQAQRLQLSYEHKGALVTSLQWNSTTTKLFVGDDKGKVTVVNVSTSRTRNLFQMPSTSLMKLDSKIVQMDFVQDHLLVSTMTRCYLCDTLKEQYSQIGKKLRDGDYGACFYPGIRLQDPYTIFSARPGSRFWEVDMKGNVLNTHQFKQALAVAPVKLATFRREIESDCGDLTYNPQSAAFHKIYTIWPSSETFPFLLTWGQRGLYIFDPKRHKVILWNNEITGVKNAKCYKNDVYIYYINGEFAKYSLVTIEKAVCHLYQHGLLVQSAQLILSKLHLLTPSILQFHMTTALLTDLKQKILDMGRMNLADSLSLALNHLEIAADSNSQDSRASSAMSEPMKLDSGIYVVSRGREKETDDDCHCRSSMRSARWRSSSPMFRQTHGNIIRSSPSVKISGRTHSYAKRPQSRSPTPVVLKEKARTHKSNSKGIKMKNDRPQDDDIETAVSTEPDSPELWNSEKPLYQNSSDNEVSRTPCCISPAEDALNSLSSAASKGELDGDSKVLSEIITSEFASVAHKDQPYTEKDKDTPMSDTYPEFDRRSCDSEDKNKVRKHSVCLEPQLEFRTESPQTGSNVKKYRPKSIEDLLPYEYRLKSGGTPSSFSSTNSSRESLIFSESQSSGKTTPQTGTPFGRSERNSPMGDIDEILLSNTYKDAVSFDSYFQFAMYGGGMMLPSSMDFSIFSGTDTVDSSIIELSKIKDSISAKLSSRTKSILQNLREFELRFRNKGQNSSELLDVGPKEKISDDQSDYGINSKAVEARSDEILNTEKESAMQCNTSVDNEDFWSFLTPVDVSNLLESSRKTRYQLRDPDIIYNKENMELILNNWFKDLITIQNVILEKIEKINTTVNMETKVPDAIDLPSNETSENKISDVNNTTSISTDQKTEQSKTRQSKENEVTSALTQKKFKYFSGGLGNFVFVYDQFRLSQVDHQLLSELATLCFQTGIYGDLIKLNKFFNKDQINMQEPNNQYYSVSSEINSFSMYNHLNVTNSLEDSLVQHHQTFSKNEIKSNVNDNILKKSSILLCSIIDTEKQKVDLQEIDQTLEAQNLNIPKNGDIPFTLRAEKSLLNSLNEGNPVNGTLLIPSVHKSQEDIVQFENSYQGPVVFKDINWTDDDYLSIFIQNFFHLLDLGRVREIITIEHKSMFKTWLTLIKGAMLLSEDDDFNKKFISGQINAAIQSLENSAWTSIVLIAHLFKLVTAHPAKVIELCVKRSHQVAPRDVLYLAKISGCYPELFMTYVDQILEPFPVLYHARLMDRLLQCEEVKWEWIQSVLNQNISQELKCKCGAPRPGSHLWPWKNSGLLQHVLISTLQDENILELCFQKGFWPGYLQIVKKLGHQKRHLLTILQLADIDLISVQHEAGYIPESIDIWKETLTLISKQQNKKDVILCLSCGEQYSCKTPFVYFSDSEHEEKWTVTLTWENIAKKLLECLGPSVALSLLQEVEIPAGSLSTIFYKTCILTHVMDQQQSALSRNMLTCLESYLWSRKPTSISPEDYQMFMKERQKFLTMSEQASSSHDTKPVYRQQSHYLEEPESHWGVRTQLLGCCPLCGISLTAHLASTTSGITVCSCGHAYHSACLPEEFCTMCSSKKGKEK
ncbi:Hermansky-Pudlak syndrome 5 protein homolog isoform X1 [Centruroides sculpturatus]|uniref:Hermansky-Pudlak syndrome 5 protein homolog isoform X1 n=2 Tax=Centruroides sculpturatus TaxID=218467 RepID=UPI000C6E3B26|nr:Hermansky-Pudlak syndrome 5 protein homolog isoform X1 [Centruroides sculpturatus]XP_023242057.1 Hermansky-Pudlak syndrome 5 protein homolog isoform X1 [Centruroides sculpturatus]XP_023242058.1 Hermansky-Pudlak syndrome 5 protein homolog isoform X1 [Centruroides sculpturatus]XP_023242060.1 Hermansky-Pudlak syndrome 5 protein homolog isoform X1 [Centruroides sculpturatus]XP_023242061.1 Hermansky-Pudlak syndrome 5 protein homolog isoform X1 [Centruroides sculpturatus]